MYNVFYDTPAGTKKYCMCDMPLETARIYMQKFRDKYLNADGSGKQFPNKKGYYQITNVRIQKG